MSDKLSELYNVLKQDDTYSSKLSDEAAFKEKFSTPEKLASLYDVLRQDDTYASKLTTVDDFKAKFAPSTTPIEKKSQVQTTSDVANTTSDSAPGVLAPPATPAPVNNNPLVPQQDQLANNIKQAATVPLNPAIMSNNPLVPNQDPLSKNIKDTQDAAVEKQKPVVQNALNKSIEKQLLSGGALTKGGDHTQAFFDGMKDKGYSDEQLDKAKDYFKSKWGDAFHNGMEGLSSTSDKEAATEKKQLAYEEDHPIAARAYDMGARVISGVEKNLFAGTLKNIAMAAKAMGQEGDPTTFATYKLGEHLNKSIDDTFKGYSNEKYKDEAQAIVASTAGSLIPFTLGGALGKTMRLAELAPEGGAIAKQMLEHLPATLQAAADNGINMFEEASQKVKDAKDLSEEQYLAKYAPDKTSVKDQSAAILEKDQLSKQDPSEVGFQAYKAGAMNAAGAFGLPIAHSLEKMDRITGGRIKGLISNGLKDGITPMMQMALQGTMNNMTAKQIFDKSREVMDGVVGAGGSGLAVGMAMSALSAVLGGHLKAAKTTEDRLLIGKAMADVNKVIQDHKEGSPLDYIKEPHADAEVNKLEKNVDDLKNVVLSPLADKPTKDMAASHLLKMEAQLQGAIEAKRIAATDKAEADVKQEVHASKEKFLQTLISTASEADKPALEAQMEALKTEAPKPASGDIKDAETKITTDEKDSKGSNEVSNASETGTTGGDQASGGKDAIGESASKEEVLKTPATPEMAKEMGFVNEHEALNSVNKRLGKDYKTFDEVTQKDLTDAKDSRGSEKKAGDQLRLFADFVEGGKISKLKGVKASSGFDMAWDLSLSAISGALKGGAKLADAVEAGLKHIRESDWYKNYTDKKGFEKQYADHMNGEFKAHVEKLSPVKKEINKTTGVTREVKKITVDSFKALKEQIRMEARAAKEGFKAGKKESAGQAKAKADHLEGLKKTLTDFVKEAHKQKLFKGDIDGRSIPSLIRSISGVKTEASLNRAIDRVEKTIDDIQYNNKLDQANSHKSFLKDMSKKKTDNKTSFSSTNKEMAKALLELHPEDVENIDHYNQVVGDFVNSVKGKEGGRQNNFEIQKYIESQKDFADNKAKEALLNDYKDLVDQGILDKNMSLKELTTIKDGVEGKPTDEDVPKDEETEKVSKARKALDTFIAYGRQSLPPDVINPDHTPLLDAVKKIDTSELSVAELKRLNNTINNIANNNDYTGAGYFEHKVAAKAHAEVIIDWFKNNPDARIREAFRTGGYKGAVDALITTKGLANTNNLLGKMTNMRAASSVINAHTIGDSINGHSRTILEHDKANKELVDIVKKHKLTFEDQIKLGIYADFSTHNPAYDNADLQAHFENNKALLKQSVKALLDSHDSNNNKMGKMLEKISLEFDAAKELSDVKLSPGQEEAHRSALDYFESKSDKLSAVAEIDENTKFNKQANYFPRSYFTIDPSVSQEVAGIGERKSMASKYINRSLTGRTKDRVIKDKLPAGKIVDYRFLDGFNKASYDVIYDINNIRNNEVMVEVFKNPDLKEFIGAKNHALLYEKANDMVDMQKGNIAIRGNKYDQAGSKIVSALTQIGLSVKVGRITQFPTQYITSAAHALINSSSPSTILHVMGHRFGLTSGSSVFKAKANELMAKAGQGVAGRDAQGFEELSQHIDREVDKSFFSDNTNKLKNTVKALRSATIAPLTISDKAVSKDIWMSGYMDSLIKQGKIKDVKDFNIDQELLAPNKEAAAFAESQVSSINNISNSTLKPSRFIETGVSSKVINSALWTLKKFSLNGLYEASNNVRTILENNGGQKEATKYVVGYAVQTAVFSALSMYAWGPMYQWASDLILDKEGHKKKEDDPTSTNGAAFGLRVATDMTIGGLATPSDEGLKFLVNEGYKMYRQQDEKLSKFEKSKDLFYQPKDKIWADYLGGIGFTPSKIYQVLSVVNDMKNNPSQASKSRASHSVILQALGMFGWLGGDINKLNENVSRQIEKETKSAEHHKDPRSLHR